mmetsp:Transcript_20131/g.49356  ORF Transcript_20131/g.49356 Transcript_20131/m.49356 type:complete len:437 (+) Transcript_20131:214-1524(+)
MEEHNAPLVPIARDGKSRRSYQSFSGEDPELAGAYSHDNAGGTWRNLRRSVSQSLLNSMNSDSSTRDSMAVQLVNRVISGVNMNRGDQQQDAKAPVQQQYFCMICRNNNSIGEGFSLRNCGHTFCRACFKQYLSVKVNDGKVHPTCFYNPTVLDRKGPTCSEEVSPEDIRRLLDSPGIEKYEKFLRRDQNSNMRDCPRCNKDQPGDPHQPWMKCVHCGHEFCFVHSNQHGPGISCNEYDAGMAKNKAFKKSEDLIRRTSKRCPGCGTNIYKISGCNHMTCTACHTGFCWLCLEEIGHSTMPEHFDPKGDNPCAGRQFENGDQAHLPLRLRLWEVHICVLLPMLLVLLLVPLMFLLVGLLSLVFCLSLCFLAMCGRECWEGIFRVAVVTLSLPVLIFSSPFWLPCVLYMHFVVAQRNREEANEYGRENEDELEAFAV